MRNIAVSLMMMATCAAHAGEIFGTLREGDRPVGAGIKVTVEAEGRSYATQTDASGSYRLFVEPEGKFSLTVNYKGKTPTFRIISFEQSTRYDLTLAPSGEDYVIKRR